MGYRIDGLVTCRSFWLDATASFKTEGDESLKTKVKTKRCAIKAFAEQNNCDAVLLTDGTIKKFMGERNNAITIYKLRDNKFYDWEVNK